MTFTKLLAATAATAVLTAGAASAQVFEDGGSDLTYDQFNQGFSESGYYEAWDQDDDAMLGEDEFATGMFADWDTDNDNVISESEFETASDRWYGDGYDMTFADFDANDSGMIEPNEFRENQDTEYFTNWDANDDNLLDQDEYTRGIYDSADLDSDQVITIEEEGWFEGWFDGDDIEAEIRDVGEL